jgi:putative aminopeptidase FrvX
MKPYIGEVVRPGVIKKKNRLDPATLFFHAHLGSHEIAIKRPAGQECNLSIESLELIEELCNAPGAPGFEDQILEIARRCVGQACRVEEDSTRNLYLRSETGSNPGPTVMIEAHSDEVGFMVQFIRPNGMLHIIPLGGWVPEVVLGQKVLVRNRQGQYLSGVMGAKPPHFVSPDQPPSKLQLSEMTLDLGVTSDEQVKETLQVDIGAPVVPQSKFQFDTALEVMLGKAFDNRLGCAGVIEAMLNLKDADLAVNPVGVLSAQEEMGVRGVEVSARRVKPQVAILFEGTPADDTFVEPFKVQGGLGKGPQLRHIDRTMISNPRFAHFALEVAKKVGIKHQQAVRDSGGTDGAKLHLSNMGVPTIVLGVPVRYAHTPHCYAALDDYHEAVRWCLEIVRQLDESVIKAF